MIKNLFGIHINYMFSILIPTFNNLEYLKICIKSLKKNSYFNNQIICHVNIGEDGTIDFLKNNIDYSFTSYNSGICEGTNKHLNLQSMIIICTHMMIFIFVQMIISY